MRGISLPELHGSFASTRDHLHQVAFFAVAPTRYRAEGRMGLQPEEGGFAAPEFAGRRVVVRGDRLVDLHGGSAREHELSTLREAVEFLGHEYEEVWYPDFHDPPSPLGPDQPLDIDPAAAHALGDWFKFGWTTLRELHDHALAGDDPSEVQLWPEHFDVATELGDQDDGQRASFGVSPGDGAHPEPYIYVAAWSELDRSESFWNDPEFNGASLSFRELNNSDDPGQTALDFFLAGHRILRS